MLLKENYCRWSTGGEIKQGLLHEGSGNEDEEATDMRHFKDVKYVVKIVTDTY